jgi:hypothetical protein
MIRASVGTNCTAVAATSRRAANDVLELSARNGAPSWEALSSEELTRLAAISMQHIGNKRFAVASSVASRRTSQDTVCHALPS